LVLFVPLLLLTLPRPCEAALPGAAAPPVTAAPAAGPEFTDTDELELPPLPPSPPCALPEEASPPIVFDDTSMLPPLTLPVLPPSAEPPRLLSDELDALDDVLIDVPLMEVELVPPLPPDVAPFLADPELASALLLPLLPSPADVLPPSALLEPSPADVLPPAVMPPRLEPLETSCLFPPDEPSPPDDLLLPSPPTLEDLESVTPTAVPVEALPPVPLPDVALLCALPLDEVEPVASPPGPLPPEPLERALPPLALPLSPAPAVAPPPELVLLEAPPAPPGPAPPEPPEPELEPAVDPAAPPV
jgi:hypothetical protein